MYIYYTYTYILYTYNINLTHVQNKHDRKVVNQYIYICSSRELNLHVITKVNCEKNAIKVYGRIRDRALGNSYHPITRTFAKMEIRDRGEAEVE